MKDQFKNEFIRKISLISGLPVLIFILFSCISLESFYAEADEPALVRSPVKLENLPYTNAGVPGVYPEGSTVARYGKLKVVGTQLCDERGNPVQLRGLFLRGLNYESKFINYEAISYLSKKWKMDVFEVPLWTVGGKWGSIIEPGYLDHPELENYIKDAVKITEECGIYCIIDWHTDLDKDPNVHKNKAHDFFKRMAFLYGSKKHVIYNICYEPNHVKWGSCIKPYAEYIIPAIRAGDSNALIIVGTEFWSIDQRHAAADPLKYENIMYAAHYFTDFPLSLTNRISSAMSNIAIFCVAWAAADSSELSINLNNARLWTDFMNSKKISWCNYNLSGIDIPAAFLKNRDKTNGGWEDKDLTESGKFVRDYFTNRKEE